MAILRDYTCNACRLVFEYSTEGSHDPSRCPKCGSIDTTSHLGGHSFKIIVPTYPGAKKIKAGYVHSHGDRPAEKKSVSVKESIV